MCWSQEVRLESMSALPWTQGSVCEYLVAESLLRGCGFGNQSTPSLCRLGMFSELVHMRKS